MIPKIIHYVWVGEKEKPELTLKCIESWKRFCPDYQIIEWNNESLKEIDNLYVKQAFEAKKWAFVSDYLRLYALKNYGGIYVDSDLEITNNLDEFLDNNFVSGYENYYNYYSPITALMGAQKNDKIISDLLIQYDTLSFIKEDGSLDLTTNTKRITWYFEEKYGLKPPYYGQELTQLEESVIIYPSYYFCVPEENKPNYSIHHFSGSWLEKPVLKYSFLEKIFSIKNSIDKQYKIFCIFGIKIKFNKNKVNLNKIQKTKIINVWQKNTRNIGDLSCAPCKYFLKLKKNAFNLDILESELLKNAENKTIILGGGGLFQRYFEKDVKNIIDLSNKNRVYIWGVGLDNYVGETSSFPKVKNVIKIGIRDFSLNKFEYVPCVSCMSKLFDKFYDLKNKTSVKCYLHDDYSAEIMKEFKDIPTLTNKKVKNLKQALKFLSDSEYILTNSYHGMYWATLLNKKVIVLPWIDEFGNVGYSQKFETFKYKPVFCKNWKEYIEKLSETKNYPMALEESRQLNIKFMSAIDI